MSIVVEIYDREPEEPSGWGSSAQVELVAAGHNVAVSTLTRRLDDRLPVLSVRPGGRYGLRVAERGFDLAVEVAEVPVSDAPVEARLLQLWPITGLDRAKGRAT